MNIAKNLLKTGLVFNMFFTIGINLVETILNDEKAMADFFGYSAIDIIKGLAATVLVLLLQLLLVQLELLS